MNINYGYKFNGKLNIKELGVSISPECNLVGKSKKIGGCLISPEQFFGGKFIKETGGVF
jgi:hypothetical protein